MKLLYKYISILLLMGFTAWFAHPTAGNWVFEWEPLLGIVVSFLSYIKLESVPSKPSKNDIALLEKLTDQFSEVAFFRDHDLQDTFDKQPMQKLCN